MEILDDRFTQFQNNQRENLGSIMHQLKVCENTFQNFLLMTILFKVYLGTLLITHLYVYMLILTKRYTTLYLHFYYQSNFGMPS